MRVSLLCVQTVVVDMLRDEMKKHTESEGFIIVGFPRNISQVKSPVFIVYLSIYLSTYLHISPWQVHHFPSRVSTARPPVALLLDCSELELARTLGARRGRLDDTKEAVARRLQTYRQDILTVVSSWDCNM